MIKTLASLGSNAARFVYSFMKANGGFCTRQQILQAGLKRTQADEVFIALQKNNLLIRVSVGYYRLTDTAPAVESTAGAVLSNSAESENSKSTAGAVQNTVRAVDSTAGAVLENITESASDKPYGKHKSTARAVHNTAGAVDSTARAELSGKPVNVVNVVNSTNQLSDKSENSAKISSTEEIDDFIENLPDEKRVAFEKLMQIYGQALPVPGMSRDLLMRIAATGFILGFQIKMDTIYDWHKEAQRAERNGNVNYEWQAVSKTVKSLYEKCGVKWTKCRPNGVITADEKLKALKIKTPNGEMSAKEFLTFKQLDNQEKYIKAKKPSKKAK